MPSLFDAIYLHIGAEKTGSSTVQRFLAANRPQLAAQGYCYPQSPGAENHISLAVYAQQSLREKGFLHQTLGAVSQAALDAFQVDFEHMFSTELAAAKAAGHRHLILSSEHCHTRVKTAQEAYRLAALLKPYARAVRIVFYLRRQDAVAVSVFSTAVRVGFNHDRPDLRPGAAAHRYNYKASCQIYERAFGRDALDVRRFGTVVGTGTSLLEDFCVAVQLSPDASFDMPPRTNESLGAEAQRLLVLVNNLAAGPFHPKTGRYRKALLDKLQAHHAGKGLLPGREEAKAFTRQFDESNEWVRARYLPDVAAPLFAQDFTRYPEHASFEGMKNDEAVAIVAQLFREQPEVVAEFTASLA